MRTMGAGTRSVVVHAGWRTTMAVAAGTSSSAWLARTPNVVRLAHGRRLAWPSGWRHRSCSAWSAWRARAPHTVERDDGRPETAPWPHEREHGDRARGDAVRMREGGIAFREELYQLVQARIVADHEHAAGGVVDRLESCDQIMDSGAVQAVF